MITHPIREPEVQTEIEARAHVLDRICQAGKLVVEFNLKDGRWMLGNVSIVFPRKHHDSAADLRATG